MEPIAFDVTNPDLNILREVIFGRLRSQSDWKTIDSDPVAAYRGYLTLSPPRQDDATLLEFLILEVFWQLTIEGIIAPGISGNQGGFPWFRVTAFGKKVIEQKGYVPNDRLGYLRLLQSRVGQSDPTVLVYVTESLETFARGSLVASTVMLGVAAERVFELLCDSLQPALLSAKEQAKLADLRKRPIRGRAHWVHEKLRSIQDQRLAGFPENAALTATGIYDMIRMQRNDLGHPREQPPHLTRDQAYANLLIFPTFYETSETIRRFLTTQKV